ncbi:flavin-containing monooxygenase [Streptomyces sp. NPDC055105]|uniref:flavin-containing monooxygenase n=1 Tax=Streptomyces sp. NPDC055105 TaxID=3365719 RepID=UPI0037D41837
MNDEIDVIVVGSGFTGLMTGAHLREAGVPGVRLVDKAGGFGGVWYWNRYPGIRCDVDALSYMPLLEEVGTLPSEKYAQGNEIREHCRALAQRYGLDEAACLQTQVTGMRWDEGTERWIVTTDRGDRMRARFVCLGSGALDNPTLPDVPGLDEFEGRVFHSSRWDYDYTGGNERGGLDKLTDKRVAVVGTAASGIPFIPHLGEHAQQVLVVQRTPPVVLPRGNQPLDPNWYQSLPSGWQRERMENRTAVMQSPPGQQPPTRDLIDDAVTGVGRRMRALAAELTGVPQNADPGTRKLMANYALMEQVRADMAAVVDDPRTAESVKPYYSFGCKSPSSVTHIGRRTTGPT